MAEQEGDLELFNREVLLRRLGGSLELLDDILGVFIQDMDNRMALIARGIQKQDFDQVFQNSHSLKGAASNVSADLLHLLLLKMEKAARERDAATVATLFFRMEEVVRRFKEVVRIQS